MFERKAQLIRSAGVSESRVCKASSFLWKQFLSLLFEARVSGSAGLACGAV